MNSWSNLYPNLEHRRDSVRNPDSIFTTLAILGRYISLYLRQIFVASGYLESTHLEPSMGVEPTTACLQGKCTTIVLRRHK